MITIIGNPENRRVQFFNQAIKQKGFVCNELSYLSILQNPLFLEEILAKTTFLKIESCGENFEVYKQLIVLGSSQNEYLNLEEDKGQIRYNDYWYKGFSILLTQIQQLIDKYKIQVFNSPTDILTMFDKEKTHYLLAQNKIEKTPFLGIVTNYYQLHSLMTQANCSKVFIKLAHGSSASGVMAYRRNNDKESLLGSVELVRENGVIKLYNSLKIRNYTKQSDIEDIINTLAKEKLLAEKWLTKAVFEQKTIDLRMVYIDGKVEYTVVRSSEYPMTNLHLGNKRGDLIKLQTLIGEEKWKSLENQVIQTVNCFDKVCVSGVDILLTPNFKKSVIIEVNAFGDLLPNVFNKEGLTTYEKQAIYIFKNY